MESNFDPYRALEPGLARGDAINGWVLSRPRQKIVQLLQGQRVLDVCCGTGNLTAMMAATGCQVVGVDSSPTMLSFAQRRRIAADWRRMDATRLPFHNEFDAAVISLALHEMAPDAREQVWACMRRAVRPQGRLIALDFAVPRSAGLRSRLAQFLVEQDERSFAGIHREHYENFKEFMRSGGLGDWIRQRPEQVETEYHFWGGVVAVVVCRVR